MCNLADYRVSNHMLVEEQPRQYTVSFPGSDYVFHLDCDGQPQPWQGGPIPDGIVIGRDQNNRSCVVFVEMKTIGDYQHDRLRDVERAQVEKAIRQILSGLYHFCPLCDCHDVQGSGCQGHTGQDHHRNWNAVFNAQAVGDLRGHRVSGAVLLLHFGFTVGPPGPPPDPASLQLGGNHLCPRKPLPRIRFIRRTRLSDDPLRLNLQDLLG